MRPTGLLLVVVSIVLATTGWTVGYIIGGMLFGIGAYILSENFRGQRQREET